MKIFVCSVLTLVFTTLVISELDNMTTVAWFVLPIYIYHIFYVSYNMVENRDTSNIALFVLYISITTESFVIPWITMTGFMHTPTIVTKILVGVYILHEILTGNVAARSIYRVKK